MRLEGARPAGGVEFDPGLIGAEPGLAQIDLQETQIARLAALSHDASFAKRLPAFQFGLALLQRDLLLFDLEVREFEGVFEELDLGGGVGGGASRSLRR